jgi:hypothetical protein
MADELERRVRTLEEELNGERHLTRYAVEQTRRNNDSVAALRTDVIAATTRLDHLVGDSAATQAALAMHGRALDVIMQDIRQLRSGQDQLRSGQDATNARLDQLQEEWTARHAELLAAIHALAGGSVSPA